MKNSHHRAEFSELAPFCCCCVPLLLASVLQVEMLGSKTLADWPEKWLFRIVLGMEEVCAGCHIHSTPLYFNHEQLFLAHLASPTVVLTRGCPCNVGGGG